MQRRKHTDPDAERRWWADQRTAMRVAGDDDGYEFDGDDDFGEY